MNISFNSRRILRQQHGFTLIEIISTLLLISICSAIVINKFGSFSSGNNLTAEANVLKNNLRYAQMYAMNSDSASFCRINFTGSPLNTYELESYEAGWVALNLPGETSNSHSMGDIYASSNTAVVFNIWGIPVDSSTLVGYANTTTITLNNSTESLSLNVQKNTGFTSL